MKFTPQTEEQIAVASLWPAGTYGFEILEAVEKLSKAGNEMIELKLRIFNNDGEERVIFDYLLESLAYKLRHAAEACGLLAKYEKGELLSWELAGKCGHLKLAVRDNKHRGTKENSVTDYVVLHGEAAPAKAPPSGHPAKEPMPWDAPAAPKDQLNDEVPF